MISVISEITDLLKIKGLLLMVVTKNKLILLITIFYKIQKFLTFGFYKKLSRNEKNASKNQESCMISEGKTQSISN